MLLMIKFNSKLYVKVVVQSAWIQLQAFL